MDALSLFLILAATTLITAICRRFGLPAPLVTVAIAIGVSLLPGLPSFTLDPELTLTVILPPLLYASALDISVVSIAEVNRPVRRLGVTLVVVTAVLVGGLLFLLVPDMTWPVALLLGAIVAPPDAVSAVAVGRKVGLPRRVMTILTGESLVNDASSLTVMKVALTIVGGTAVTLLGGIGVFALTVFVGIVVGLLLGVVSVWLRRVFRDPTVQILFGLVLPFFAYVGAEHLDGSGVLAVVTAGLVVGYSSPQSDYQLRLQEKPVWDAVNVALEGFVFALIGLQFPAVIDDLAQSDRGLLPSIAVAVIVLLACIVVRFGYVFLSSARGNARVRAQERRLATRPPGGRDARPGRAGRAGRRDRERQGEVRLRWQEMFVISWSGMRGVVTIAAAIGVPAVTGTGVAVPAHDLIILVAFVVTVGSLLLHGLSLPFVARRLGVIAPDQAEQDEASKAAFLRASLTEAVQDVVEEARRDPAAFPGMSSGMVEAFRARLEGIEGLGGRPLLPRQSPPGPSAVPGPLAPDSDAAPSGRDADIARVHDGVVTLRRSILAKRRSILIRERNLGHLDEDVVREILLTFDASELVLDQQSSPTGFGG